MSKRVVQQFVDRERVVQQLADFDVPHYVFAELVGVSPTAFSFWVRNERAFSVQAQGTVLEIVQFVRDLRERYDLPIDFSDVKALKPHLARWRAMRSEAEVVRTETELRARREAAEQNGE